MCVTLLLLLLLQVRKNRYVILPKDFEKGYKANVKKSGDEFAFYQ
jgi:26S proteasome regulatory subunit T3